jgi:hypothetical protein
MKMTTEVQFEVILDWQRTRDIILSIRCLEILLSLPLSIEEVDKLIKELTTARSSAIRMAEDYARLQQEAEEVHMLYSDPDSGGWGGGDPPKL